MLKFVFDTNVLVSALISKRGNPALLLELIEYGKIKIITPKAALDLLKSN